MEPTVIAYDPDWPRRFEAERALLEPVLAPWLAQGIHHIGSTAVVGLAAKPIIDMLAGVRDLEAARAAIEPLHALGYRYREHRPEAHLLAKPGYGIHLTEPGSDLWRERLAFRDALRTNPDLAARYADWKVRHVARTPGTRAYTADKFPLVAAALADLGITLKPDRERLTARALSDRDNDPLGPPGFEPGTNRL